MKIFQVISLEEVSVLTAEMPAQVSSAGRAVGWKPVCRQPCASWQFLEAAPGLCLCRELLTSDHPLPGAPPSGAIWRYGVWRLPGHQTTPRLGPGSAWHSISSARSASNFLYEGPFLINILTAHSISVLLLRTQPAAVRFVLA